MDFTLSSSTVLGAAVLLWLLWGVPYLRRRLQPAGDAGVLLAEAAEGMGVPSSGASTGSQEAVIGKIESARATSARQSQEEGKHVTDPTPVRGRLRIRWGRCALAGIGLAGLVVAAVGGVLAVFHVLRAAVPIAGIAGFVIAVVVLRRLAIADRRRRVKVAFQAAVAESPAAPEAPQVPRREATEVFDHQPEPELARPAISRDELRAAALEVARAAQEAAAEAATREGITEVDSWEPVDVPKPSYMEAAKAERDAPEPLEAPDQPKPEGKVTLKPKQEPADAAPGVRVAPPARPAGRGALGNLDAVLQRRRA